MQSPKFKRNLSRILPYGIIWLIIGWLILFIQEAATQHQNLNPDAAITLTPSVFVFASVAVALVGFTVGALEVLWLGRIFAKKSFFKKIFLKVAFYGVFLTLVMFIVYPIAAGLELELSPLHPRVLEKLSNFFVSLDFASTAVSLGFSLFISLFYSEISDNVGHGVLMNFFTGRYHKPREEERVFLFADMKSSTSIAEKLGHTQYFQLLRDYYQDFSDAIINSSGEVYQYVGDEIVITWRVHQNQNIHNCLDCFLAMKKRLKAKSSYYQNKYGVVPTFKAGLHIGKVTTGEIGDLKKDIIFTGDVLNTTARIQALCNELSTDILLSQNLVSQMKPSSKFAFKTVGAHPLRGKEEVLELFTIVSVNL
ncbi:adenylate/guanylate cyclase domain-containing protein [Euzebyella saccharophila]|uniref:Adenylate/guanylate cyclase domain-containing protein n=1 Tax=Euzebyella saccharophila TaxID=679664 RepID=A0ABV8JUQ0_9FLAO|nr:adenylate/guanylate cyclase domain-containing protein [Euzebyella saccharophila]